jgi:hypothetical protein
LKELERSLEDFDEKKGREILNNFIELCGYIKSMVFKLKKLEELSSKEELSKSISSSLKEEYLPQLSRAIGQYFELRSQLEELRAKTLIEIEKIRLDIESTPEANLHHEDKSSAELVQLQSRLRVLKQKENKLNEILLNVRKYLLEDLDLDTKIFIASHYLEANSGNLNQMENKDFIRNFLDHITELWFDRKNELSKEISELERRNLDIEDQLKELWARFLLGEYDRNFYLKKKSELERNLLEIQEKISEAKSNIEKTDIRIIELWNLIENK